MNIPDQYAWQTMTTSRSRVSGKITNEDKAAKDEKKKAEEKVEELNKQIGKAESEREQARKRMSQHSAVIQSCIILAIVCYWSVTPREFAKYHESTGWCSWET